MPNAISADELRRNLGPILDRVLETGRPQQVVRNGQRLVIIPARRRLESIPRRRAMTCTFDELVETSWEAAWEPEL